VVDRGADDVIVDYLIGPLPLSKDTTVRPLTEIYHQPSIPLNARSTFNWTNLGRYMAFALEPLNEVTLDLYGGVVGDKVLAVAGTGPMSYDGTWRRSWLQLRWDKPGGWLRPIDFYVYTDFTGTDPTKYKVLRILHDGKTYNTMDEVKAAWRNGTLKRASPEPSDWSSRAIKGKRRDLDDRAGPRRVMFDGPRYRLDREEQYITWMGWALYLSFERDMGLHLWDM
jgi:primary-amine oxidase